MGSLIALLVIATVAVVVVRIGATALMMTGLSTDIASFQAYSAFFGVGFTTAEAELVVNHPMRRKIIRHLILAGNIGLTGALASTVTAFVATTFQEAVLRVGIIAVGLGALLLLSRSHVLCRLVDRTILSAMRRSHSPIVADYALLLRVDAGYAISEVELDTGHWLVGRTLGQSELSTLGVLVLGIRRREGEHIGTPRAQTLLMPGDVLTVYGHEPRVRAVMDPCWLDKCEDEPQSSKAEPSSPETATEATETGT